MRRILIITMLICLCAGAAAWAAGQEDEPQGPAKKAPGSKAQGIDFGFYVDAGKALRLFDVGRLNHALAKGGVDPFTGAIDDWNFELVSVAPHGGYFALGGGFWGVRTGGGSVDAPNPSNLDPGPKYHSGGAELSGWEILGRVGPAVLDSRLIQLYPTFGIGYSSRTLTLKGDLRGFHDIITSLPRHGGVDLRQGGMLLEAALRLDMMDAWPAESKNAFLSALSFSLGWQGVPIFSSWTRGTKTVHGVPADFINALFVRLNIGIGAGVRKPPKEKN